MSRLSHFLTVLNKYIESGYNYQPNRLQPERKADEIKSSYDTLMEIEKLKAIMNDGWNVFKE